MRYTVAIALTLGLLAANSVVALPPIVPYIEESLGGKEEYKGYLAAAKAAKSKCASCHIPDKDKKAKGHGLNDFGQAMHKHLDDKGFMAADKITKDAAAKDDDKKAAKAKALELFNSAWTKAIVDKNAEGKAFGDLIKEGKLPGKND